MLTMPPGASPVVSIIGIDPGTDTLGVADLRFNVETLAIVSTEARTLHGAKAGRGSMVTAIHGDRWGRIEALYEALIDIFCRCQPISIASESPFVNRRQPLAGMALSEVIAMIRHAIMQYDAWKYLYLLSPPTVKTAVGAPGHIGGVQGKQNVKLGLLRLAPILHYQGAVPLHLLDEHSCDALAVAYCRYCNLLEELCLKNQK